MSDNIVSIDNVTILSKHRQLTEAEARAGLRVLWLAVRKARLTVTDWVDRDHRPTKQEMSNFANALKAVDDEVYAMAGSRPSDGHGLDALIERLEAAIEPFDPS